MAATELKIKLDSGAEFTGQMVDDLASEFDIDGPTLMREFRTITGSTPTDHAPKTLIDMSEKMIEAAQRRARDLRGRLSRDRPFGTTYRDSDGKQQEFEVGRIFTRNRHTDAFVGWQSPHPGETYLGGIEGRRRTHMIRVSDATHHVLPGIVWPTT